MFDISLLAVTPLVLLTACLLDLLVGDPAWIPHPVRWIGKTIDGLETLRRKISLPDWFLGAAVGVGLPGLVGVLVLVVLVVAREFHYLLYAGVSVYLLWSSLSVRSLYQAGRDVLDPLREGTLEEARRAVGRIVGRRTENLDRSQVSRAGVEAIAEGFLDGVLAPIFWVLVGGIPGVIVYKTVNTLDSMIGYRSDDYREFGRVSARFDDVMNWVPARISLLVVPAAAMLSGVSTGEAIRVGLADRNRHPSPNAGHPEAVFAGALGCRLGGRTEYDGYNESKPYLNGTARPADPANFNQSLNLYIVAAGLLEITCLSFLLLT